MFIPRQLLKNDEVRALVAHLGSPRPVPLPAAEDNVKAFFNGKDLRGRHGNPNEWSVEKGEIAGRGPAIKKERVHG